MFLDRIFRATDSTDLKNAYSLADAARGAYQTALSEGLPLAHIAEQSGRPQYWFANNILHVVEVHGRAPNETSHTLLSREVIAGLKLADDMSALVDPSDGEPKYGELCVTKDQFERYLAWARTVY